MTLQFEYLVDRPDDVPLVISWWHSKWADRMGTDIEKATHQLRASLSKDKLPVHILAVENGRMIGTATLKEQEMVEVYPNLKYWLGSVFVAPASRGNGIATALTEQIIRLAQQRHLPQLYLHTENISGGLYAAQGFEPMDRLVYKNTETLLMRRPL